MATSVHGDVSLVLSRLLDSLGLDEDTRQRRMDRKKMEQLLWSLRYETLIRGVSVLLSGSAYETTTIDGLSSDIDIMAIPHHTRVIDDIQQWKPDTRVNTYMIDNTGCYPAFVKLYLLSPDYPGPLYRDMLSDIPPCHVVDDDGKILLCNDGANIALQSRMTGTTELHGPAVSRIGELDWDLVYTLMCKSFPREAEHWKRRQTQDTRARIGGAIIDQATCCYLVGVGNKGSPTENVEWRLSFSHIENQLVHAWNNVHYKCYVMMKFIHKDLIKPKVPDCILCSYHYKTTLMWMVEEYPTKFFIESNFSKCILAVLKNLDICVTRKSLPHYFVQGCNLFHNRLDEESSKQTANVIETIISTWPDCLCDIKRRGLGEQLLDSLLQVPMDTICKFNLQYRREHFLKFEFSVEATLLFLCYKNIRVGILTKCHTDVFKLLLNLVQFSKRIKFSDTLKNRQSVTFMVKDNICSVGLQLLRHSDSMPNKAALHYKRLGLGCIQRCINDCCFDTQLQIAEYFTRVGNYQRALLLLDNIESRIKDYTDYGCWHAGCGERVSTFHAKAVFDNKPSVKEYCKYYHAAAVTYTQDNLPHVPRSLVYEMFRTTAVPSLVLDPMNYHWYNHAVIHCPVFLNYLRFLCFHALERYAHRQVALDNMAWTSEQLETSPGTHIETNHNVLGDCYRTLGQLNKAYREYRKSLLKQKYRNAAIWHLALLVRRKVCNDPSQYNIRPSDIN